MTPTLTKSPVAFDEASHTYTLEGRRLGGVTPIVGWMFPDTYADIPQAVLDRAAAHGHFVHSQCQLVYNLGIMPENAADETVACMRLTDGAGLKHLASEYLVSDGRHIASSIDVVFADMSLADIKTTSKIHKDNVTLQLSIYAWLFEMQNPGLTAGRLYVIWLPKAMYGEPALLELGRIPSEDCAAIVETYLRGGSPDELRGRIFPDHVPANKPAETLPTTLEDAEASIVRLDAQLKDLQAKRDALASGLLGLMEKAGVKKWEGGRLTLTYMAAGKRKTFDSTRFKAEHPDTYAEYQKESETKATVRITVKKKKDE